MSKGLKIGAQIALLLLCAAGAHAADLSITTSGLAGITQNSTATFTLHVVNNGPMLPAPIVTTVVDTVPAKFTQISGGGASWGCTPVGQTVTCNHPGPSGVGQAFPPITITAKATGMGAFSECATVSFIANAAVQPDLVPGNNNSCVNGTILPGSHLQNGTIATQAQKVVGAGAQ